MEFGFRNESSVKICCLSRAIPKWINVKCSKRERNEENKGLLRDRKQ